jgi:hypothetical protein
VREMSAEVENLDLLIKFMGMTRSNSDSEALIALKKANEHLDRFKATWEDLLRAKVKITVVADPFSGLPEPPLSAGNGSASAHKMQPMTPPSAPSAMRTPPPYTPPRMRPSTVPPSANMYAGNCHKCGKYVDAQAGLRTKISGRWRVECPPNSGCGSNLDSFFDN